MNKRRFLMHAVWLFALFGGGLCAAGQPVPSDGRAEMVTEMKAAVREIAARHGNIAFTEIFTNQPERAAAVRRRFMEIERSTSLDREIEELGKRSQALQETVRSEEAVVRELERRIAVRKLELKALQEPQEAKQP